MNELVLVVEDDPQVAELFRRSLAKEGFDPVIVSTIHEAREELARKRLPDLVIIDVYLPNGDGREIIQEIPEGIPSMLVSGSDHSADVLDKMDLLLAAGRLRQRLGSLLVGEGHRGVSGRQGRFLG